MREAGAETLPRVGVITVDDQPFFRGAAHDVIQATPGFEPLAEAASGAEALTLVEELDPALVLVDVRMPGMDGIETARRIKEACPDVVVFLISIEDPSNIPAEAQNAGAATLIRKRDFRPRLLRQLWDCYGGRVSK